MNFKVVAAILCAVGAGAQPAHQPFQAHAASTVSLSKVGEMEEVDITNVTYEVTQAFVPTKAGTDRLLLRQTCTTTAVMEEPEWGSTTVLEAWPLGASLSQKPLYTIKAAGPRGRTVDEGLFVIERGTGEVEWWSVYQLGTGQHLFDTYVPLVGFSISRETLSMRYIGFEVPPDDATDARLKQPNVVGVITYASAEGKKREALLTAVSPKTAAELRSYADSTRTLSVMEGAPPKGIRIFISQNAPAPANPLSLTIPVAADNIDVEHAQLPAGLHLTRWKR